MFQILRMLRDKIAVPAGILSGGSDDAATGWFVTI
jgi:hypothetical protein